MDEQPELSTAGVGDHTALVAAGNWTARYADCVDALVNACSETLTPNESRRIDMSAVSHFDTYGASMLDRLMRAANARGVALQVIGLAEPFLALTVAVQRAAPGRHQAPTALSFQSQVINKLEQLGRSTESTGQELLALLNMLGAVGNTLARTIRAPSTFRLTATVHQLDRVAWQAVPIIVMITFLIGGIIAQQGFFHFRKFGADQYVVDMVGLLVVREMGVLLVAIMVAGRSGSSYTAELGSMKMREEIDALRTMGLDPVAVLIVPRIVALVIALPILALLGCLAALYGGGLVASIYGGMHPDIYWARLQEALSITHFKVGMIKAPFMALGIGLIACSEGLKVRGSAESLGLRTTASVVKSIFLVIVLDGLFAIYFAAIGM